VSFDMIYNMLKVLLPLFNHL